MSLYPVFLIFTFIHLKLTKQMLAAWGTQENSEDLRNDRHCDYLVKPATSHTGNTLDQWMGWTGKVKLNQEVKPCLTVVQRYVRLTPLNTTTDEMGSNLYGYIFNISLPLQKNMNVLWVPTRVKTEYTDRRPETKSLDFIK